MITLLKRVFENYFKFKDYDAGVNGRYRLKAKHYKSVENTSIVRPTHIDTYQSGEHIPYWEHLDEQENYIMQWWYKHHNKPCEYILSENERNTLSVWLGIANKDGKKLNLKNLLKGKLRHVTPIDLIATGFYVFDSSVPNEFASSIRYFNRFPKTLNFIRRTSKGSWDVVLSVPDGKVISVTTRLRLSNSGIYRPEPIWNNKKFWRLTFVDNSPVLEHVDQYLELNEVSYS